MVKRNSKSPLMAAIHQTAEDMARLGLIEKHTMRTYDALCLTPVPSYDAEEIKALRKTFHLSQAVLAAVLNTSASTVRKWEAGEKSPSGPSLKLLNILERKGLETII